jgi:hypothetical protein
MERDGDREAISATLKKKCNAGQSDDDDCRTQMCAPYLLRETTFWKGRELLI